MTERRHPLVELTRARLLEFVREPEALFWVFAFPVLLTLALGIAFRSRGPEPVVVGVEPGAGAEAMRRALGADPLLQVRDVLPEDVTRMLRNGSVHIVVTPGAPPAYRYDPDRPESRLARLAVDAALQRAAGREDVFVPEERRDVPRGSRYIDWVLPGLVGLNIMGTGMWGIGFSIVQARTRKLLKRLIATPMRRRHYLASHVLARLVFLVAEVVALVGFGVLAFGTPLHGSVMALAAICVLGALSFGGLGLLVASRARTIEAVSGWMNVVMLPMWLLSGVFFSSEHFPAAMQPVIQALPLTALNDALRANMIDGAPLLASWPDIIMLAGWGSLSFVVALRAFRWQ